MEVPSNERTDVRNALARLGQAEARDRRRTKVLVDDPIDPQTVGHSPGFPFPSRPVPLPREGREVTPNLMGEGYDLYFAVMAVLHERPLLSNRAVARKVGSTHPTIGKMRRELADDSEGILDQLHAAGFHPELGLKAGVPVDTPLQRLIARREARLARVAAEIVGAIADARDEVGASPITGLGRR